MDESDDWYEDMKARRAAEHRAASRDLSWDFVRTGLACLFWCTMGLVCFGFALHTTDVGVGRILVWAANIVTYSGITMTCARFYLRGERRGDW